MSTKPIVVKQGPYFRGCLSTMGLFAAVIFLLFFIAGFVQGEFYLAVICLVGLLITGNIGLGLEGLEFDLKRKKFRKYRTILGFRNGDWKDLSPYDTLALSAQYVRSTSPLSGGSRDSKNFELNLASTQEGVKAILLEEPNGYAKAKKRLAFFEERLGIEGRDFYKEHALRQMNKRRR